MQRLLSRACAVPTIQIHPIILISETHLYTSIIILGKLPSFIGPLDTTHDAFNRANPRLPHTRGLIRRDKVHKLPPRKKQRPSPPRSLDQFRHRKDPERPRNPVLISCRSRANRRLRLALPVRNTREIHTDFARQVAASSPPASSTRN